MFRDISFKGGGGELINPKAQKSMHVKKNQIVKLKVLNTYIFNEVPYFIMQGKGLAYIEEMPNTRPCFYLVKLENLDYYMQYKEHISDSYAEQQQIEMFYGISQANEAYRAPRFYTFEFNELEKRLYGFNGIEVIEVERF